MFLGVFPVTGCGRFYSLNRLHQSQSYVAQSQSYVAQMQGHVTQMQGYVTQMQGYVTQMQGYVTQMQGYVTQCLYLIWVDYRQQIYPAIVYDVCPQMQMVSPQILF